MCGRYYIPEEDVSEDLRQIIEEISRRHNGNDSVKTSGEIYPSDCVPVVANNKNLIPTPFAMQWGYTLADGKKIINARSETAADKALFRDGMENRRCLIPAGNYFEWEKRGKEKIKHAIRPADSPSMYMAGIYRLEKGKPVFTILTRSPADSIAFIHNRMPIILPREAHKDWLNIRYDAGEVLRAAVGDVRFWMV